MKTHRILLVLATGAGAVTGLSAAVSSAATRSEVAVSCSADAPTDDPGSSPPTEPSPTSETAASESPEVTPPIGSAASTETPTSAQPTAGGSTTTTAASESPAVATTESRPIGEAATSSEPVSSPPEPSTTGGEPGASIVPPTTTGVAVAEPAATAGPVGLRAPTAEPAPPPRRVVRGTTTVELYYDNQGRVRLRRWEGVGLVPGPTPSSDPLCLVPHMTLRELRVKGDWAIEIRADVLKNLDCKLLPLHVRGVGDSGAFLVPIYRDAAKGTTDGVTVYFTAPMDPRTNRSAAVDIEIRCVEP